MRKTAVALCIAASSLLTSCAITPSPALQAKQAALQAKQAEFNQTIPVCTDEKDCKAKWEAAQIWIVRNSGYKIQTATDVLLQTYNPTDGSLRIGVQAVKEPLGGGQYRIVVEVYCNNIFGCIPNSLDAAIDFNRFVGAATP